MGKPSPGPSSSAVPRESIIGVDSYFFSNFAAFQPLNFRFLTTWCDYSGWINRCIMYYALIQLHNVPQISYLFLKGLLLSFIRQCTIRFGDIRNFIIWLIDSLTHWNFILTRAMLIFKMASTFTFSEDIWIHLYSPNQRCQKKHHLVYNKRETDVLVVRQHHAPLTDQQRQIC